MAQVKYCNGTAVRVPTDAAQGFEMQGETIESLITPRTKAIMINTPNNPTGCVMSEQSLQTIAELGFDLPNTSALVKRELEPCGIAWEDTFAPL